jgi:hypothetical protein
MSDLLDRLISKYGSKPRVDLDAIIDRLREGGELTEAQREILEFTPAQQLPGIAERWRNRRDFYRSTQDYFDPSDWRVDAMAGKSGALGGVSAARLRAAPLTARRNAWQAGRDFITTNHYAASFPQVRVMVGIAKESQANLYGGVDVDEIMELSRFVLLDDVPGNAETWFLARATEIARQVHAMRRYELKVLLSFSDPVPRRSMEGFLTMPGHIGNIYQAHNALYVGYSSSKTLHLNPQGLAPDPRMLSKIRALDKRDEQGGREGARRLVDHYGAPSRRRGESYTAWLKRVLASGCARRSSDGSQTGSPTRRRRDSSTSTCTASTSGPGVAGTRPTSPNLPPRSSRPGCG